MIFVRFYAQVSLVVVGIIVAYAAVALRFGTPPGELSLVISILSALWMICSIVALFVFPSFNAPMWAPLLFIGYSIVNYVLTLLVGLAYKDSSGWLHTLHESPAAMHWARIGFSVALAALNVHLLMRLPKRPKLEKV